MQGFLIICSKKHLAAAGSTIPDVLTKAFSVATEQGSLELYTLPASPPQGDALAIVLFAGMLGWLGAQLSVTRHLRHIEPA